MLNECWLFSMFCDIHNKSNFIVNAQPIILYNEFCFIFFLLNLLPHLSGVNELKCCIKRNWAWSSLWLNGIWHNSKWSRGYQRDKNNKANLRDLIAATGLVISNWIQIVNFSARVTVKFDGWPCKTIGHLFYATSSFVHHFVAIGEFKLQLQSGNAQSGSNSTIFRAVRPWNLTDDLAKQ